MTSLCLTCNECKLRFFKNNIYLVKARQSFERINNYFRRPLPFATNDKYILTVVDEFSRFPFTFPCAKYWAQNLCNKSLWIFIFGMLVYVHWNRGSSLMRTDLKKHLRSTGVTTRHTTPYNPQGNGQCKYYNGTIWKIISLGSKNSELSLTHWETMIPDALCSIRTLINAWTNWTPHSPPSPAPSMNGYFSINIDLQQMQHSYLAFYTRPPFFKKACSKMEIWFSYWVS